MNLIRTAPLLLSLAPALALLYADALSVRLKGDRLFVSAPKLDLLRGPVLARLKTGSAVAFDFSLALWIGSRTSLRRQAFERFTVSYDLWEEKFAVTHLRKPRTGATGLAAPAVERWCLEQIALPAVDLPASEPFWVRLDVRVAEPRQEQEPGPISLTALIEILSRPARAGELRWSLESGALRRSEITP